MKETKMTVNAVVYNDYHVHVVWKDGTINTHPYVFRNRRDAKRWINTLLTGEGDAVDAKIKKLSFRGPRNA